MNNIYLGKNWTEQMLSHVIYQMLDFSYGHPKLTNPWSASEFINFDFTLIANEMLS